MVVFNSETMVEHEKILVMVSAVFIDLLYFENKKRSLLILFIAAPVVWLKFKNKPVDSILHHYQKRKFRRLLL